MQVTAAGDARRLSVAPTGTAAVSADVVSPTSASSESPGPCARGVSAGIGSDRDECVPRRRQTPTSASSPGWSLAGSTETGAADGHALARPRRAHTRDVWSIPGRRPPAILTNQRGRTPTECTRSSPQYPLVEVPHRRAAWPARPPLHPNRRRAECGRGPHSASLEDHGKYRAPLRLLKRARPRRRAGTPESTSRRAVLHVRLARVPPGRWSRQRTATQRRRAWRARRGHRVARVVDFSRSGLRCSPRPSAGWGLRRARGRHRGALRGWRAASAQALARAPTRRARPATDPPARFGRCHRGSKPGRPVTSSRTSIREWRRTTGQPVARQAPRREELPRSDRPSSCPAFVHTNRHRADSPRSTVTWRAQPGAVDQVRAGATEHCCVPTSRR
jgi:hypothetical protein